MNTSLSGKSSVWQFHWYGKIYAFAWILNDSTAFSWIATLALLARNDEQKVFLAQWQRTLSFWAFYKKATQRVARRSRSKKIHALNTQIHTLNLWILRCAQYDKDFVGMTKFISMTNKKFLWCAWGFVVVWGIFVFFLGVCGVLRGFGVWLGWIFGDFVIWSVAKNPLWISF